METLYTIAETIYTPQGDGNSLVTALFTMSGETTHTPQGDGNIDDPILRDGQQLKQLTPRKGTVTLQRQRRCPSRQRQLTPRKGTVTKLFLPHATAMRNNLHPARGRPFGKEGSS